MKRLTREEKRKIQRTKANAIGIAVISCIFTVGMVAGYGATAARASSEDPTPASVMESEDVRLVGEDPMEAEKIEAALIEQGYFRDDVPLTFDEQDFLHTACEEFGVDYHLMLSLIDLESDFRNVIGDGGDSYGYTQIQPRWWSGLMEEIGADDLMDPYDNFRTSCAILAHL